MGVPGGCQPARPVPYRGGVIATRRERVILDLTDRLSPGLAQAAVASALLQRSLGGTNAQLTQTQQTTQRTQRSIDQFSGRLSLLAEVAAVIGPALAPIGAVGVGALAGLASQMGFTVVAAGSMALAFRGLGDALGAVNEARINPTAANLEKAREALDKLTPAAQALVSQLAQLAPVMDELKASSQAGFGGIADGLEAVARRAPDLERIFSSVSYGLGQIAAATGESLASDRWDEFFSFLEANAAPALADMAASAGSLGHALAELWMAFDPINDDFSTGLRESAAAFDDWASGLSQTEGFEEFLAYIEESGPRVWDALGAIANALLQIIEAAAPVGSVVLPILETLADGIGAIADSEIGSPLIAAAAAMSLLSRATALWGATSAVSARQFVAGQVAATRANLALATQINMSRAGVAQSAAAMQALRTQAMGLGKGIAMAGLAMLAFNEDAGLSNTAMLALAGSMAGPWGAAAGAAVGLTLDLASAANEADKAIADWQASMAKSEGSLEAQQDVLAKARAQLTAYNDDVSNAGWGKISNLFDPDAIMNGWEAFATGQSTVEKMAAALQDLEAQSAANEAAVVELAAAFGDDITPVWKDASVAADDYASTLERARPAMDALGLSVQDLADMDSSQLSDATKRIADWTKYADSGQGRTAALADAVSGLSSDMLSTADSAAELSTALDELLSPALDAEAATDAWRKALAELRTELSNTAGFSGYSEAAMKNREATRSYTEATIAMLKSRAEAGAGEKEIARLLQQSREEFIRQGVAAGQNAEVMRRRANILGLTPKLVRTVMEAAGVELTTRQVRKLREEYRGLPAKVRTQLETPGYQLTKKNIQELRREYDLTPAQVRTLIELRDAEARRAITGVQRELDKTGQMRPNPRVTADGSQASGVLSRLLDQMRALHDKSVTVTTTYVTRHIRKEQTESGMGPQPASLLGSLGGLQGARGGRRDQGWENAPKPDEPLRRFDTRMPVEQGARLSGITSELSELRSSMAEAGIRWTRSMTRQAGSLKVLGAAYDEQTEALDAAAQAVDQSRQSLSELQQEASAFGAQSIGRFNADLFAEDGLSGVMRRLGSNAGGAESMLSTLQALAAAGLDGEAFRMLAGSGDLRAAQQLLAGGSEAIAAYESGVARQLAAQQQLSQYVQDSVYGKAIADQTEVVRRQLAAMEQQQARLAELNAKIAAQTAVLEQAIKEEAPKRTGKEVADALSGVAADSARLRPRRPIDVGGPL